MSRTPTLRDEGASFVRSLVDAPIPSTLFSVTFEGGAARFAGELSEIQHAGHRMLSALFVDAADRGFVLRSERTGELAVFVFEREEIDDDGELVAYHFVVSAATARRHPRLVGARVVAYND